MSTYQDVYGLTYQDSIEQMSILKNSIESMQGKGFVSAKACAEWAKENLLDKVVFSKMSHGFQYVSHRGEILTSGAFLNYYGNILYYKSGDKVIKWLPSDFKYLSNAYIVSEATDGLHRPLYHRNYFQPTGCYDFGAGSFNIAKTYPVFAKETGRDTTHIYLYIQHVAGECAMWLLAWLRAKLLHPTVKTQVVPVIVSRSQGSGKGQPLRCKVLTRNGFIRIGDLKVGDLIMSPVTGKEQRVVAINHKGKRHVNKVTMYNGAVTYCDDDHLWSMQTVRERSAHKGFKVVNMDYLKSIPLSRTYNAKKGAYKSKQVFLPLTAPLEMTGIAQPMPYAVGMWLGDGCEAAKSIVINEDDMLERFAKEIKEFGYELSYACKDRWRPRRKGAKVTFVDFLVKLGVRGKAAEKRIPKAYLHADLETRRAVLEGLIDTDGSLAPGNVIDFSSVSKGLIEDAAFLVQSLGVEVHPRATKEQPCYTKPDGTKGFGQTSYRIAFKCPEGLHLSKKHTARFRPIQHGAFMSIKSIEDAGEEECQCIQVEDELYITDDFIVTHNSTIGEVICKGLFGADNVLVTDQYDSQARFNADYADALIVCQEEREETDKRNPASAIKSRATATMIRKELKGVDPIYQESFTDFIITTNKDVPIKFDGREDQRRFMVMNADEHFTRKESRLADEVFSKLYGFDANMQRVGVPFVDDHELIAQFKHELFSREDIAKVELRNFPHTAAYNRCFTLPRTNEATDIESIALGLAPFIRASLEAGHIVTEINGNELKDVALPSALEYIPPFMGMPAIVAVCRPVVFCDLQTSRAFQHSTVERGLYGLAQVFIENYGIELMSEMTPIPGGFTAVKGRYKLAPAARFVLPGTSRELKKPEPIEKIIPFDFSSLINREGQRFRVNEYFKPDANGCFETVNELPTDAEDLKDKNKRVLYKDTFLLEADYAPAAIIEQEKLLADKFFGQYGDKKEMNAEDLYAKRLKIQFDEASALFSKGKVCRIVYSGAKSMHLLVRVAESPDTLEEYKWLHSYLCSSMSEILEFDTACADPARLTRSPIEFERHTEAYGVKIKGKQRLMKEDFAHVNLIRWRKLYEAWKTRPFQSYERKGKRIMPMKQKYTDAMTALLEGKFWCDPLWNGRRQEVFFTAYRLLRMSGYSRYELWDEILMKNIDCYYKPNEVNYWKTREDCALIKTIDEDVDAQEEE